MIYSLLLLQNKNPANVRERGEGVGSWVSWDILHTIVSSLKWSTTSVVIMKPKVSFGVSTYKELLHTQTNTQAHTDTHASTHRHTCKHTQTHTQARRHTRKHTHACKYRHMPEGKCCCLARLWDTDFLTCWLIHLTWVLPAKFFPHHLHLIRLSSKSTYSGCSSLDSPTSFTVLARVASMCSYSWYTHIVFHITYYSMGPIWAQQAKCCMAWVVHVI